MILPLGCANVSYCHVLNLLLLHLLQSCTMSVSCRLSSSRVIRGNPEAIRAGNKRRQQQKCRAENCKGGPRDPVINGVINGPYEKSRQQIGLPGVNFFLLIRGSISPPFTSGSVAKRPTCNYKFRIHQIISFRRGAYPSKN